MSSLPNETNTTLSNILLGFASPNNEIRQEAEKQLNSNWITTENISILLIFLSEQAAFSNDLTLSALSAVLFRKLSIRAPPSSKTLIIAKNITHINNESLTIIRETLLKGFLSTDSITNNIKHKLSDAIAECAQDDLPPWPELIETLLNILNSNDDNNSSIFKESAFRILSVVPNLINSIDLQIILSIFQSGFINPDDNIKISAVTAFVGFFKQLPKNYWSKFNILLPSLLNSLPKFLDDGKDDALTSVFESLIELIELAPKLFKDMFDQIIEFTCLIIKNTDLMTSTRTTALELLTAFSEYSPQMCKTNSNYSQSIIEMTLLLMTEVSIDDDQALEWQNSDDTDDADEDESTYDHARQSLDRVSLKLGGKYLAQPLFQYLQHMMNNSNDWRQRFASLMALSSAAEGCRDVLISEIQKILEMVVPLINDPHPRVQYGCCNVLGQISTDFAPLIQLTSHSQILPALISKLTPNSIDRVQTHAAAALVNFSEHANKDILDPYLDSLLTNLLNLLQRDKLYVQEQALTTIAFIAEAAEKKFIKYYDTLMPLLLKVLKTDTGADNRVLKGKCIECATLIALAVGKEKFTEQYSQELINLLGMYQGQEMADDDALKPYLEHGWSRICRILTTDFIPLLNVVLPSLIKSAKATQDVSLIEEEDAANFQQYSEWDVVQIQGKHIAIHTSILDDKVTAMDLLQVYSSVLGSHFAPYVKDILTEIAIPSIDFYLHDGVRATGASFIPILLTCLLSSVNDPKNPELVQLYTLSCNKLIAGISVEPMPEISQIYLTALIVCLQLMHQSSTPDEEMMASFTKGITASLTDIYRRFDERKNQEDEYNEDLDEDYDEYTDENLLDSINKSIHVMFQVSGGNYIKYFPQLWPIVDTFMKDSNSILNIFAFTAIADMVQFTQEESHNFKDSFIGNITSSLISPDPSIRQASAFVIGICAQYAPNTFADVCVPAVDTLLQLISIPEAKSEENETATDNASATLAKIMQAYQSTLAANIPNYIEAWFKSLPTTGDEEAAAYNYKFLAQLVDSNGLSNLDSSRISNIAKYIVEALHGKVLTGKDATIVVDSVKKLLGTLPQEEAMQILQAFPPEVMETVKTWFS